MSLKDENLFNSIPQAWCQKGSWEGILQVVLTSCPILPLPGTDLLQTHLKKTSTSFCRQSLTDSHCAKNIHLQKNQSYLVAEYG